MIKWILLFLLVPELCFGAEFLIQAKPHWKDEWGVQTVNKLSVEEKKSYDARIEIGDIVVIKPNGWVWGREESLPNYYIVKVPNISVEDSQYAIKSITEIDGTLLKKRRYKIPNQIINQLDANNGVMTYNLSSEVIDNLIDKL